MTHPNARHPRSGVFVAAVLLLSLPAAPAANAQEEVPVIENGFRGSMRRGPELVRQAAAGQEGPEASLLYRPVDMFTGPDDRLYIVDAGTHAVHVYDRDGSFVRQIGREGEGPGEFRLPNAGFFTYDGELVILDPGNQRRSFFTPGGEYLRSELIPPGVMNTAPVRMENGLWARTGAGGQFVVRRSIGGRLDAVIPEQEDPALIEVVDGAGTALVRTGEPKLHEDTLIAMLLNRLALAWHPDGHLVAGFQNANEIHVYDARTGELERIITRRLAFVPKEPEMTTQTENLPDPDGQGTRVRIMARPDVDPITEDLAVDTAGRIWVLTRLTSRLEAEEKEEAGDYAGLARIEVFSLAGELLATIELDLSPTQLCFDSRGDLWLLDARTELAAFRYTVRWPG